MAKMNLDKAADILLVVGGLNWGLALFNINLVTMLLGGFPIAVQIVYGAVGVAAVYKIKELL